MDTTQRNSSETNHAGDRSAPVDVTGIGGPRRDTDGASEIGLAQGEGAQASGRDEPSIRFLGDEPELYLEFNHELVRLLAAQVRASREDIDDAAAFAWVQFFRYQPDRDRSWKGWLFRTAQREAWRLTAERGRASLRIVSEQEARAPGATREPVDPRDPLEERLEFLAAMEEVRRLPKKLRAAVLLRAQLGRHRDVAEVLGVSVGRVTRLLQEAGVYFQERTMRRAELERAFASPRAARLRELEVDPPAWLLEAIGRAPTFNKSSAKPVLAWRRAALAIDDYRNQAGWHSEQVGIGPTPADRDARRAHERAQRAMRQLTAERSHRQGRAIER